MSEETQTWLKENYGEHRFWNESMWPPYSPDLNPMDYFVWGYVESKACKNPHSSVSSLQKSVNHWWSELLTEDMVKKACSVAWDRVNRMIEARGCTFEPKKKPRDQAKTFTATMESANSADPPAAAESGNSTVGQLGELLPRAPAEEDDSIEGAMSSARASHLEQVGIPASAEISASAGIPASAEIERGTN